MLENSLKVAFSSSGRKQMGKKNALWARNVAHFHSSQLAFVNSKFNTVFKSYNKKKSQERIKRLEIQDFGVR